MSRRKTSLAPKKSSLISVNIQVPNGIHYGKEKGSIIISISAPAPTPVMLASLPISRGEVIFLISTSKFDIFVGSSEHKH